MDRDTDGRAEHARSHRAPTVHRARRAARPSAGTPGRRTRATRRILVPRPPGRALTSRWSPLTVTRIAGLRRLAGRGLARPRDAEGGQSFRSLPVSFGACPTTTLPSLSESLYRFRSLSVGFRAFSPLSEPFRRFRSLLSETGVHGPLVASPSRCDQSHMSRGGSSSPPPRCRRPFDIIVYHRTARRYGDSTTISVQSQYHLTTVPSITSQLKRYSDLTFYVESTMPRYRRTSTARGRRLTRISAPPSDSDIRAAL